MSVVKMKAIAFLNLPPLARFLRLLREGKKDPQSRLEQFLHLQRNLTPYCLLKWQIWQVLGKRLSLRKPLSSYPLTRLLRGHSIVVPCDLK